MSTKINGAVTPWRIIIVSWLFPLSLCFGGLTDAREETLTPKPSTGSSLLIEDILVENNSVLSSSELESIIAPYRGRALNVDDIQALRNALTLKYISKGYLNSGVIVPEQDLSDGVLRLQAVEGRLLAVNVDGNKRLSDRYIRKRVQPELDPAGNKGANAPLLNVNQLQQRLRLLEQNPRIQRLNGNLKPGIRLGEAELDLTVEEARPYYFKATFDNHLSPNVGDWQGTINVGHLNLLGFGDSVNFKYQDAEGWESYRLDYTIPLGFRGTTLTLSASDSRSEVVSEPFDILDIKSESESYGVNVRHPLYRTLTTEFALGLGFEQRRSGSYLLGDPFAFVNNGPDGKSEVNVVSFLQDFVHRRTDQVWAVQSRFDVGLDVMDATKGDEPDGIFNAWLGQAQWLRQFYTDDDSLWSNSQLLWRLLVRLTDEPMLSSEQFAIGGQATVRGYRENQVTRGNGVVTSLEWRIDVSRWLPASVKSGDGASRLQLAPFIDYGNGWDWRDSVEHEDLSSMGVGFYWAVNRNWSAQLHLAKALNTVTSNGEYSLQDDGIHLQLAFTL